MTDAYVDQDTTGHMEAEIKRLRAENERLRAVIEWLWAAQEPMVE